jgi:succinate-semialdehyde dehydrogenase/glutarate-semialdehyde dehydrogenase
LTNTTPQMRCFREELFGPVAGIMKFSCNDEVLKMANDTEYGLSSYIFTQDERTIARFTHELAFGEVHVNTVRYHINLPHGGIKDSGIGCDCSVYAMDDYLVKKRITTVL